MNKNQYFGDRVVSPNQELTEKITEAINNWANSLEGHPFDNLGDEIEIEQVSEIYCYRGITQTQFEQRSLDTGQTAYYGQELSEGRPVSYRYVLDNLFAYRLKPKPHSFTSSDDTFVIDESKYKDTCTGCQGKGKVTCCDCGGKGSYKCRTCNGTGAVDDIRKCSSCGGHGSFQRQKNEIYYENGVQKSRITDEWVTCSSCNGKGVRNYGKKTCDTCRGSGRIVCDTCGGKGTVKCTSCLGSGEVMHYITINQKFEVPQKKTHWVELSDEDFELMKQALQDSDYVDIDCFENPDGAIDMNDYEHLDFYSEQFQYAVEKAAAIADTQHTRLLFQSLQIQRTKLIAVDYKFMDDSYELFVTESGTVFASVSPISLYGEVLLMQIAEDAPKRKLFKIRKSLIDLESMSDDRSYTEARWEIEKIMCADFELAVRWTVPLIMVLLFGLNLHYIQNVSFAAPWIDLERVSQRWIWTCLPFIYTIIEGIGGYWLASKLEETIACSLRGFILRFTAGILTALISVAAAVIVLYLLHFLILPALWDTLGFLINLIPNIFGLKWL